MLDHALGLVKPGGTLLFIVCSLEPEEGEAQVDDFLRRQPNVALEPFDAEAVSGLPDALTPAGTLRILPSYYAHNGGVDGFSPLDSGSVRCQNSPEQSVPAQPLTDRTLSRERCLQTRPPFRI